MPSIEEISVRDSIVAKSCPLHGPERKTNPFSSTKSYLVAKDLERCLAFSVMKITQVLNP